MKKYFLLFFSIFLYTNSFSQVGIGTTKVDGSAILEIKSNEADKGLLLPRVSLASPTTSLGVTPLESLLVYNTNAAPASLDKGFYYWSGSRWESLLTNINDLSVITTTPWNVIGTTTKSSSYLDDIYLSGNLTISPNNNRTDETFYLVSDQTESNNVTFGHFSNTASEGFEINFGTGFGTTYGNANSVDNNVIGSNRDWDVGSLRFSRARGAFFGTNKVPFAEIKVKTWGNGDIRVDRAPSQMWFEVCEDGDDNPDRIFRIDLHGRIQFVNSESVNNWSTSNLSTDKVVGITSGVLRKIDKNNLSPPSTNQQTDASQIDIKQFVLNEESLNLSNNKSNALLVVTSSKQSPISILNCPTYNSNDEAKDNGLSTGMVYKAANGQLKIVF